jgi:phosphohistidine phosphatase
MLLYVMRHGPAEDRAPTGRDFDRALTKAGRELVLRAARALCEARRPHAPRPWRLLTSPFRRALQTAEIVASVAAPLAVEVNDDLAADAEVPLALVEELRLAGTDVILVGHQPNVEELARALVHPGRSPLRGSFGTATILTLETTLPSGWDPVALLDPHGFHGGGP